jgi:hypothetical protein
MLQYGRVTFGTMEAVLFSGRWRKSRRAGPDPPSRRGKSPVVPAQLYTITNCTNCNGLENLQQIYSEATISSCNSEFFKQHLLK